MIKPLHAISIIPLNDATLCADLDCRVVSNMLRCPVCDSQTIAIHTIVNETKREVVELAPIIE